MNAFEEIAELCNEDYSSCGFAKLIGDEPLPKPGDVLPPAVWYSECSEDDQDPPRWEDGETLPGTQATPIRRDHCGTVTTAAVHNAMHWHASGFPDTVALVRGEQVLEWSSGEVLIKDATVVAVYSKDSVIELLG
jgi:hypothetical protein